MATKELAAGMMTTAEDKMTTAVKNSAASLDTSYAYREITRRRGHFTIVDAGGTGWPRSRLLPWQALTMMPQRRDLSLPGDPVPPLWSARCWSPPPRCDIEKKLRQ